jgi:hypothetical protein
MKKHIIIIILLMIFMCFRNVVHAVTFTIHDTLAVKGAIVDIPVYVDEDLSSFQVSAYSLQIIFDADKMQALGVVTDQTISSALGTPVVNTDQQGMVTLGAAGTGYLSGNGVFIIIRFKMLDTGGCDLIFTGKNNNYLNEGTPVLIFDNAWISIENPPTIQIYSDKNCIAKGDSLQLWVWGGNEPYRWTVSDTVKAEITSTGMLSALETGTITIYAEDAAGIKDSLMNFTIHPFKLSVPDHLSQWNSNSIDIPVYITDVTASEISSGSFRLNYNTSLLHATSFVNDGTLLNISQIDMNTDDNGVQIAFATPGTLQGAGILLFIRCMVTDATIYSTELSFSEIIFNENIHSAFDNGQFTTQQFRQLYIYPITGEMLTGDTLQMEVLSEYTPPVSWSVSNPDVAEISSTGLLRAKKGGMTRVIATDSTGSKGFTDDFFLLDTRVILPDTTICVGNELLRIPVIMDYLNDAADEIYSMEFELKYDTTWMTFSGLSYENIVPTGWMQLSNDQSGRILYAGSGASAISQTGTIVHFNFELKEKFSIYDWAGFMLDRIRINEGTPVVNEIMYSGLNREDVPGKPEVVWGDTLLGEFTYVSSLSVNEVPNAHHYVWVLPSGMTGNSTTNSIEVSVTEQFEAGIVTVYAMNSCGPGESFEFKVTKESHSGNSSINNDGYLCYPNPVNEIIHVRIPPEVRGITSLMLYDMPGRLLQIHTLIEQENVVTLKDLPEGIYLLKLMSNKKTIFMRIMKE